MNKLAIAVCGLLIALSATAASAQTFIDIDHSVAIDAKRGVDRRVDYEALIQFGPWDDRNYQLTADDLKYLPSDEAQIDDLIPAFYRVQFRKHFKTLSRDGAIRYPLHAYPTFRAVYQGYEVNGQYYNRFQRDTDGRLMLDLKPEPPATSSAPETDFVSGDVRITSPNGGAESAIKIHPTDVNKIIAGSNGPGSGQKMYYSLNGGSTWTQTTLPLGGTNGDPAVEWSSTGQFAYTTTLGNCFFGCAVWFYRSADNGATWSSLETVTPGSPRRTVTPGNGDREFLHVDKSATSPFKDRIYVFFHENNVMQISRSADFGNTFTKTSFPNLSEERGIAGDVATDPSGNIYYVWPAFNSQRVLMKKSTDGGVTFGATKIIANTNASFTYSLPSMDSRNAAIYAAVDTDLSSGAFRGSIYATWGDTVSPESGIPADNHSRVWVARSRDGGNTWQLSTPHETSDLNAVDRYHPFLVVGNNGTVHVVYYDTRRDASRQSVDLFYAYSTDGAVTWSAPQRITSAQSPNLNDGFEFGDYNGLDIAVNNMIAIYTDNRKEAGEVGDSKDVYGSGITPGAAAGAGSVPDGKTIPGAQMLVTKSGANITLTWSAACGGGSDYATYEGDLGVENSFVQKACSSGGATSITFAPATGNRSYIVVPQLGANEGSYGRKSNGTERTPAAVACRTQVIHGCP
ncbi:MAG: hypothetical protein U0V87_17045 [Acidobacteriota bacterium]